MNHFNSTNMEHILYHSTLETIPLNHALNKQIKQIENKLSFKIFDGIFLNNQFGENIAYDDSIGAFLDANNLKNIIKQQWFDIHKYYNYNNNKCDPLQDCNSYQKLLWAKTRYIACGVSICPELYLPNNQKISKPVAYIVCNYWPTYDKDEIPIYKTVSIKNDNKITNNICTQCPMDRTQCNNGLCSGCPAPNYNYCQDRLPICAESKDKCENDLLIHIYCAYTCLCSRNDLIPETQCNNLYLYQPSISPTISPINNNCQRLGWYDVSEIETNSNIKCSNGYILPNNNELIEYILNNCLYNNDINKLNDIIYIGPITYKQHGIAMNWPQYNKGGCDWDNNYNNDVILTHNGYKCGDAKQLFICINIKYITYSPSELSNTY